MTQVFLTEILRRCARLDVRTSNLTTTTPKKARRPGQLVVQALVASYIACGWRLKLRNRDLVAFLLHTYQLACRYPHQTVTRIKGSCLAARRRALQRDSDKANIRGVLYPKCFTPSYEELYQLSCVSRALPLPSELVEEAARNKFMDLVLDPDQSVLNEDNPNQVLRIIDDFFKRESKTIARFKRKYKPDNWKVSSGSSCYGISKKDGGRSLHYKMNTPPPKREAFSFSKMKPCFKQNTGALEAIEQRKLRNYIKAVTPRMPEGASEVVAVRERGYKARIVTKSNPVRVAAAHAIRKALYPLVTQREHCVESLNDTPKRLRTSFKGKSSVPPNYYIVSMDLTSATDTVKHYFLDRLARELGVNPVLIHAGFTIGGAPVYRGLFMGMPCSWTILEWIHHFVCYTIDPKNKNFWIKGDDLIAIWTHPQIERYKKILSAFGFIINDRKTFYSRYFGTYCEGLYKLVDGYLSLQPTTSMRSWVVDGSTPKHVAISAASRRALRAGLPPRIVFQLVETFFTSELAQARKMGLPLHLPNWAGGLGIPPEDPSRDLTKYERLIFWGAVDADLPGVHIVDQPLGEYTRETLDILKRLKYRTGVPSGDRCPHLEDAIAHRFEKASIRDAGPHKNVKFYSFTRYLRDLKRILRKVKLVDRSGSSVKWSTADAVTVFPTPKTLQNVYPHKCEGGLTKWNDVEELRGYLGTLGLPRSNSVQYDTPPYQGAFRTSRKGIRARKEIRKKLLAGFEPVNEDSVDYVPPW